MSRDEPEIILEPDPRHITKNHDKGWNAFIEGITKAVAQRGSEQFPMAKLNTDGSVSLLLHTCSKADCVLCSASKPFEDSLLTPYIVDQIEFQRKSRGYPLTKDDALQCIELINKSEVTNVAEYRIHLSPEHLDALLKLTQAYPYRSQHGGESLLKLRKNIALKPGVICLCPLLRLDKDKTDGPFYMRVAGCQASELPIVQLLHLLPEFDGIEKPFHWEIPMVTQQLGVDRQVIEQILQRLLVENQMVEKGVRVWLQSLDGFQVVKNPCKAAKYPLKVTEMTPESRHIYLTYGNVTDDEIDQCLSMEIELGPFYDLLVEIIQQQLSYYKENPNPTISTKLMHARVTLNQLKTSIPARLPEAPDFRGGGGGGSGS